MSLLMHFVWDVLTITVSQLLFILLYEHEQNSWYVYDSEYEAKCQKYQIHSMYVFRQCLENTVIFNNRNIVH